MEEKENIICAASKYDRKYYFNPKYQLLPREIQEQLQILCVKFTNECGGILMLSFDDDYNLNLVTKASVEDILYDEISAGIMIGKIRRENEALFDILEKFYRYIIKKDYNIDKNS